VRRLCGQAARAFPHTYEHAGNGSSRRSSSVTPKRAELLSLNTSTLRQTLGILSLRRRSPTFHAARASFFRTRGVLDEERHARSLRSASFRGLGISFSTPFENLT
jgi:hypothetical protein